MSYDELSENEPFEGELPPSDEERKVPVHRLSLYNPSRLSDADVKAAFTARQSLFDLIIDDVQSEEPENSAQHHLIIGQRGMGKSLLLTRIAAELRTNPVLRKRFIPLVFAEEQYSVDRLSKFWLNCLDSLADEQEQSVQDDEQDPEAIPKKPGIGVEQIDEIVEQFDLVEGLREDEAAFAEAALQAFLLAADTTGRRPVLLVDNLQIVFKRLSVAAQHSLRELMLRQGSPILIGASPTPIAGSEDYTAPFYDNFKVHYLSPLTLDEMRLVVLQLAKITDRADVAKRVSQYPERLPVLRQLTGGNPRTTVTLFFLYSEDFAPNVFGDLENLLDRVTPLYKAIFDELPDQQQVIASAIAEFWNPVTSATLAQRTGLANSQISPQLSRMEQTGFLEKVSLYDTASNGYQIAERFFNIWFLMRGASRRQRRQVEFLTRFLQSFYTAADRDQIVRRLLLQRRFTPEGFITARAIAESVDNQLIREDLKRHTELIALRERRRAPRTPYCDSFEAIIDFKGLPPAALRFDELREKLAALVPRKAKVKPYEFADKVLGSPALFRGGERDKLAASPQKLTNEKIEALLEAINASRSEDEQNYSKEAVDWVSERLEKGFLSSATDVADWNQIFENIDNSDVHLDSQEKENCLRLMLRTLTPTVGSQLSDNALSHISQYLKPTENDSRTWGFWAAHLIDNLGRIEEGMEAYRKTTELDPQNSMAFSNLGAILDDLGRFAEAESICRKAIDLDIRNNSAWNNLGTALQGLARYEEAELAHSKAIEIDPQDSKAWGNLADAYYMQDRYAEGESVSRKAIEIDPQNSVAWAMLGIALYMLERYEEVIEAYRKAIEIDPQNSVAWTGLGIVFYKLEHYEEGVQAYRKAIDIDPQGSFAWNRLGEVLRALERHEEAVEAHRQAIELNPRDAVLWSSLGIALYAQERYEESVEAQRKAIDIDPRDAVAWNRLGITLSTQQRYEKAVEAYGKAIDIDPRDGVLWRNLGNALYMLERYEEAVEAYRKAIEFAPQDSVTWNRLGEVLYALERYEESVEAQRKAIDIDPRDAVAWNVLGNSFHALERFEEGVEAYGKAIEIEPRNGVLWSNLGNALYMLERHGEAVEAYRKASNLNPEDKAVWKRFGNALYTLEHYEEAAKIYGKVTELDPRDDSTWNSLGNVFYSQERYEEGVEMYRKAIEIEPRDGVLWRNLGNALYMLERYEEAVEAYRKAIEFAPQNSVAWNGLGEVLYVLERFEEAVLPFNNASEINPGETNTWNYLGSSLNKAGRIEEAVGVYRKAIELDPTNFFAWLDLALCYYDEMYRFDEADRAFRRANELLSGRESSHDELQALLNGQMWFHRDYLGEGTSAHPLLKPLQELPPGESSFLELVELHQGLFSAYEHNWGLATQSLLAALKHVENGIPSDHLSMWMRTSAVLLNLGYGKQLIKLLEDNSYHLRLRPWYEALKAVCEGTRDYLQNVAPEVRTTAEEIYDGIAKRMAALPDSTRQWSPPAPSKTTAGKKRKR